MVKSSAIVGIVTFVLILISGLLSSVCCLISPLTAVFLGLAAGYLAAYFEKITDPEKAAVRGAIAGAVTGAVALVAQLIGQTASQYLSGATQACLPGMCAEASAPISDVGVALYYIFNSCFCGLILLALMAGLGAAGSVIRVRTSKKMPDADSGKTVTSGQ
jgi:hypothetical protein